MMRLASARRPRTLRRVWLPGVVVGIVVGLVAAPTAVGWASSPPPSSDLATVSEAPRSTVRVPGSGDLWPSCWSDDGNVYTANGDGVNFGGTVYYDTAVGRLEGTPETGLTGTFLAGGSAVGPVWNSDYNRKPTGMACVGGDLYMAVQDLKATNPGMFDDAPAATIVKSSDRGRTWTWDPTAPMFGSASTSDPQRHVFTTIMFLDYGKDNVHAPDGYVYAYGIDNNWTQSYSGVVPDPQALYLARVPESSIMNRSTWQFYTGTVGGTPTWSSNIASRAPVLEDTRRTYENIWGTDPHDFSVIGQGGVVYNPGLQRYLYTSFSGSITQGSATHDFYESTTPWGPWKLLASNDFGMAASWLNHNGGYAPSIPSKFISADGTRMWLQSNVCACVSGVSDYQYALRPLTIKPFTSRTASNGRDNGGNLAMTAEGVVPISKSAHNAHLGYLSDGNLSNSEDDWDAENKTASWWGYTFTRPYTMNMVVMTSGAVYSDGGWFASGLRVQVRQNGHWVDVVSTGGNPGYPYSPSAGPYKGYAFTFDPISGDGVRVIGVPGGSMTFSSIAELAVYYGGDYPVGGDIAAKYNALGGAAGFLGPAITEERVTPDGVGRYNHFRNNGSIYWTPSTGAHEVHGRILDLWASRGWELSPLGYPTSDEMPDPIGRRSNFQDGYILYNASTGVATAYDSAGNPIP